MRRTALAPATSISLALSAVIVLGAGALAWRAARPPRVSLPDRLAAIETLPPGEDTPLDTSPSPIPDRALAAVLRVDLFPPPPTESPAAVSAPPPRLDVELVAILITAATSASEEGATIRRAFLYDAKSQTYSTLGVGDALREGVTVLAIDDESATFQIAQGNDKSRSVRMELKP
jgi:hypothetical protein